MNIAIIGSRGYPYVYSGYETFVKELSERLTKKGVQVTVYCHGNLFDQFPKNVNGIHLVYIRSIEKKTLSQFIHSFQSILHACFRSYDIILVVNSANGPFGIFTKIFRKKTVINVDGLEWRRPKWKGLGAKYFYWASWLATRLYDVIIADCLEMQKIYAEEFHCRSAMIAYGANIRESQHPEMIHKWNIKPNDYYLIVGRLIPDNNVMLIVREFMLTNSLKKLVIVGDVPYQDSYAMRVKAVSDHRIILTGYIRDQNELAELYHHCFIYIHGHEYGGTNPSLLSALAYGCAICALDTPFSREVLDDGKFGLFFTKSEGSLQGKILEIEADGRQLEDFRKKSRIRIAENYTWNKITEQYFELFRILTRK